MFGSNTEGVVLRNREYIRDLYCPDLNNAFQVIDSVPLNPGLLNSFPWLSQVASNYEEYEFLQLAVTYKSTINPSIATNGQVGQVCMATNYNPDQDAFASKEEMVSYSGGMSAKTSSSMVCGVECDPAKNSGSAGKYIRTGFVPESKKDYDLGTTYIAVLNAPKDYLGQCLGEIWVSYTVVLRKPRITVGENYLLPTVTACCSSVTSTPSAPNAFGIQNDSELKVSTKATMDVTFLRPATAGDNIPATDPSGANLDQFSSDIPNTAALITPLEQMIAVQFPPWYSGIVEIVINARFKTSTNLITPIDCMAQGQVFRYYDIPWDTEAGVPVVPKFVHKQMTIVASQANIGLVDACVTVIHARIQPSLNGVPCILWFGSATQTGITSTLHSSITVRGINTNLSFDDAMQGTVAKNRSGGRLMLTDSDTGIATVYP